MKKLSKNFFQMTFWLCLLAAGGAMTANAATYTVTNTNDSGAGSLRQAIIDANATPDDDEINFDATVFTGTQTITLTSGEFDIVNAGALTINGTGADRLSISGNRQSRVFRIFSGANVTLNGLTVRDGFFTRIGGGIYNEGGSLNITNSSISNNSVFSGSSSSLGGGIYSNGSLKITNSKITGNSASSNYSNGSGGGIQTSGYVTITDSVISNNLVHGGIHQSGIGGGIIHLSGTLNITNSTISGNSVRYDNGPYSGQNLGGGIFCSLATVNITNSTISGNSLMEAEESKGGGIFINNATVNARNTIISGNTAASAPDLYGSLAVNDHNIISGNAMLAPLGYYGGTTQTHALLSGSSAINAGNDCVLTATCADFNAPAALTTDQRGQSRKYDVAVDIGAVERQADTDGDDLEDFRDNCPNTANADQADSDGDGTGDACEDTTAPVISPIVTGTMGNDGWYISDVTVSWSVTDAESNVSGSTGCEMQTVSTDTSGMTFTCSASSAGGSSSNSVTIKRDATAPVLNPTVSPNPVLLGSPATASPNASDALSGLASESCGTPSTSSVGFKSVTCTATDKAGNSANANANYQVVYNFRGFFQPIENLPTVNIVTAGQTIPIKFSLTGYQGMAIFAPGFPASSPVACDQSAPGNTIEEISTPGSSTLTYAAGTDRYSYNWKTDKAWKGTCRILVVKLDDGKERYAKFSFK